MRQREERGSSRKRPGGEEYGNPPGQCSTMEHHFPKAIRECRRRCGSGDRQAQYGNAEAVEIARDLDVKVRRLLQEAS